MSYKPGDSFTIKVTDIHYPDINGTEKYQTTILVINGDKFLITVDSRANFATKLGQDDIDFYSKKGYSIISKIKNFIGAASFWIDETHFKNSLIESKSSTIKSSGIACTGPCAEFNEYAEPNMKDGSYKCYSCRHF